jgi:hypothetical protein
MVKTKHTEKIVIQLDKIIQMPILNEISCFAISHWISHSKVERTNIPSKASPVAESAMHRNNSNYLNKQEKKNKLCFFCWAAILLTFARITTAKQNKSGIICGGQYNLTASTHVVAKHACR